MTPATAAKARAAVKKLIYTDKVFMIHGGSCSAAVFAARDEFIDAKVPFMVMAATLDSISDPPNKYIFTTALPGSGDGGVILNFAKSIPDAKKIAIVRHANEWADAKMKRINDGYKAAGLEVVADVQLEGKATDATSQVLKIKAANPDATLFILYPAESAVFLRDAEKYGLKGPFIGTTSVMDLKDLAERAGSKTALKDVYVTAFLKGPVGSPELAKYTDLYKKQFPNDKLQSLSFYGMSGAITIADAIKKAGTDLTREKFIAALESTKNGEAGPAFCQVNFSATRRQGCLDGTIWALKDDAIVIIGPTCPKAKYDARRATARAADRQCSRRPLARERRSDRLGYTREAPPWTHLTLIVAGLANGSLYALVALGLVLIYKTQDVVNFAHGEVLMVGRVHRLHRVPASRLVVPDRTGHRGDRRAAFSAR